MSKLNIAANKLPGIVTHGGAPATRTTSLNELRRSVFSCFLWEKEFYEDGVEIAKRIHGSASQCSFKEVVDIAIEARTIHGLRHVPLLLLVNLLSVSRNHVDGDPRLANVIATVINRPDEMTELLYLYWTLQGGRQKTTRLDHQLQKGLALAFHKFDEYQLAKWDRDGPVRLRDVLRLAHVKAKSEEENELFKRVLNKELKTPDTWEVELSAGKDKKTTFERLIQEGKLNYMALLKNLRNMVQAGCDSQLVKKAILEKKGAKWVLPFRYTAAARHAPQYERELDTALMSTIKELPYLRGTTTILVDVSGSMGHPLSAKSDMNRMDAAATLASIINGESLRIFTFSSRLVEVPPRPGMAGVDAIIRSQNHSSTELARAIDNVNKNVKTDRLIVITDEQATGRHERIPNPVCRRSYMINVASYKNGVSYNPHWVHIDGFSENVIKYIYELENSL